MTTQQPDFDSIRRTNIYGMEYWSARDLSPLLGYDKWQNFQEVINKAITACDQSQNNITDHFTDTSKMVPLGSGSQRKLKDYHLSRFACYLVAQNGQSSKPEIAAAQAYFAISTRQNELTQLYREQQQRLEARLKVSESFKALGEVAAASGVDSEFFGIFIDAGYLGLHRHTRDELIALKNIPEGEEYLDNITRAELAAIDFKNTQTEQRLLSDQTTDKEEAAQTHYFVGDQVRKAIEAIHAPMPEDLPAASSIRKMVEERRRATKKRLNKKQESHDQEPLF